MVTVFRKSDILSSLILGELVAVFVLLISKNLEHDIPILDILVKSKWLVFFLVPLLATFGVYSTFRLGRRNPVFFQFGKFLTIGLSNSSIDFGILNLLMFLTNIESGYLYSLFKAISFLVAVINSYFWNKFWTFESTGTTIGKEVLQFITISGIGFGINVIVASLIVNIIGPFGEISPRLWANIGAFAAIVVSVFWNFTGYKFIVFKN
jgi:putative flippase GtrA